MIRSFIIQHAQDFILHCHNPNLGKNPAFTMAIYQLARQGIQHRQSLPRFSGGQAGEYEEIE